MTHNHECNNDHEGNDHHHHDHDHNHGHMGHHHIKPTDNLAVAFALNSGFAVIELVGGLLTNSVAIMSDALHDLGDSISLGMAWYFQKLSQKPRNEEFTYGYKRFSVLGAFINATILSVGSIFIIKEAILRIINPEPSNATGMLFLALLGIAVNGAAMLRLQSGKSLNERVVSLHLLEDVLGWVAVLLGSIAMIFFNLPILDPILSLLIATFILFNIYKNLKPAVKIILQAVPTDKKSQIEKIIKSEKEVTNIHDFHFWTLDGENHILSFHLVVNKDLNISQTDELKSRLKAKLSKININHATIEIEYSESDCQQIDCS